MKRVLVVALALSLLHSSVAFATGPLLEAAKRATRALALDLAQTPPDPQKAAEAKRTATELGVGKQVAVTLTSGKTLRGRLQEVNDDHLVLLQGATRMAIAYGEVDALGSIEVGKGWKIAMWVGVGAVAAVATLLIVGDQLSGY